MGVARPLRNIIVDEAATAKEEEEEEVHGAPVRGRVRKSPLERKRDGMLWNGRRSFLTTTVWLREGDLGGMWPMVCGCPYMDVVEILC